MEDMSISTNQNYDFCRPRGQTWSWTAWQAFQLPAHCEDVWCVKIIASSSNCVLKGSKPVAIQLGSHSTGSARNCDRCNKDKQTVSVSVGSKKGTCNCQMSKAFTWCRTLVSSANWQSQNDTPCPQACTCALQWFVRLTPQQPPHKSGQGSLHSSILKLSWLVHRLGVFNCNVLLWTWQAKNRSIAPLPTLPIFPWILLTPNAKPAGPREDSAGSPIAGHLPSPAKKVRDEPAMDCGWGSCSGNDTHHASVGDDVKKTQNKQPVRLITLSHSISA